MADDSAALATGRVDKPGVEGVSGEQDARNADGLTFEQWEEASWAAIDGLELDLGDDALELQRKAKARRRSERDSGQDVANDDKSSGWRSEQTMPAKPAATSATRQIGHSARAPVAFGLAKKKTAKVPMPSAASREWFREGPGAKELPGKDGQAEQAAPSANTGGSDICSNAPTLGAVSEDSGVSGEDTKAAAPAAAAAALGSAAAAALASAPAKVEAGTGCGGLLSLDNAPLLTAPTTSGHSETSSVTVPTQSPLSTVPESGTTLLETAPFLAQKGAFTTAAQEDTKTRFSTVEAGCAPQKSQCAELTVVEHEAHGNDDTTGSAASDKAKSAGHSKRRASGSDGSTKPVEATDRDRDRGHGRGRDRDRERERGRGRSRDRTIGRSEKRTRTSAEVLGSSSRQKKDRRPQRSQHGGRGRSRDRSRSRRRRPRDGRPRQESSRSRSRSSSRSSDGQHGRSRRRRRRHGEAQPDDSEHLLIPADSAPKDGQSLEEELRKRLQASLERTHRSKKRSGA